jgi:heme exporter protein B
MSGLLSAPVDPAAIYAGKLLANVVLLGVTQAVVVPLVGLFLHVDLWGVLPGLVAVLGLGNVGFASLATLFAAVASRTRAREVMLPLLLLPLLVPLLIGAVTATRAVLGGGLAAAREGIAVLVAFDVVFVVAGWLLFAYVVRD